MLSRDIIYSRFCILDVPGAVRCSRLVAFESLNRINNAYTASEHPRPLFEVTNALMISFSVDLVSDQNTFMYPPFILIAQLSGRAPLLRRLNGYNEAYSHWCF